MPSNFTKNCFFVILMSAMLLLPGCSGCRSQQTPDQKAKLDQDKEKKPKPDFEMTSLTILPSAVEEEDEAEDESQRNSNAATAPSDGDLQAAGKGESEQSAFDSMQTLTRSAVKPGHWVEVRHGLRTNNFDFLGELSTNVLDRSLRPVPLKRTPFRLISTRPTSLPKEQQKYVETPVFIQEVTNGESRMLQIGTQLKSRSGNRVMDFAARPTIRMNAHQFYFVVMSDDPDRYGYLKTLNTIRPPEASDDEWDSLPGDYALKFINADEPLPLPSNGLTWTSTAFVVWDAFDPKALSTDQQTALVDWLHWGGRLIVSGPKSLDRLRGSFIEPYLPALADRTIAVEEQLIEQLSSDWTIYPRRLKRARDQYALTIGSQPLEVVELELLPGGKFTPTTADLVAERKVGRGSIAVTAFSLTDRRIINWPSFDSFFNGCLMRRTPRRFRQVEGFADVSWIDSRIRRDAMKTCGLRYFVRDADVVSEASERSVTEEHRLNTARPGFPPSDATSAKTTSAPGYLSDPMSGVAGWTDFSAVANAARKSLQSSSGISVPQRDFIAKVLGLYLLCLVPLNWLLFRLVGRVEWAWAAAPVIAIAGGIGIVKVAQLDIGFVRARTELAIVEMQDDYSRGHVTRYTGLYTSLSSDYAVEFEDATALAAPFSLNPTSDQLRLQTESEVDYRRDTKVGLSGFPVISNSTGMVHVEQFVNFDGGMRLVEEEGRVQLENDSSIGFDGSLVIHRDSDSTCRVAVLGSLAAESSRAVRFADEGQWEQVKEYLGNEPATRFTSYGDGGLGLRGLVEIALTWQQLDVGGYRFIGWNNEELPGMEVSPSSNQSMFRTLVVANVHYAPFGEPRSDENLMESFKSRYADE